LPGELEVLPLTPEHPVRRSGSERPENNAAKKRIRGTGDLILFLSAAQPSTKKVHRSASMYEGE
jgi:hypothetical protein